MNRLIFTAVFIIAAVTAYAAGSGEDTFYKKCTSCHGSGLSLNKNKTEAQWASTINRMKKHGLTISSSESKSVAKFLSGGN